MNTDYSTNDDINIVDNDVSHIHIPQVICLKRASSIDTIVSTNTNKQSSDQSQPHEITHIHERRTTHNTANAQVSARVHTNRACKTRAQQ